ncbi:MAG: IS4 family transposase, partial [Acidobacteriota bacterium]
MSEIRAALEKTGKTSMRQRDLPAHVVVYYVVALAIYMQSSYREVLRCLLEGVQWLLGPSSRVRVAGRSGISQARTRLGWQPMKELHDALVGPVAVEGTRGAWYRRWRLASLDGSTLDVADTGANAVEFGRPSASRGMSAYPQVRFVSLVENGTHVLFGSQTGGYRDGETTLARGLTRWIGPGMLCLADRNFFGFDLWQEMRATGSDQLWRVKKNLRLPCQKRLADGSFLSTIYASDADRRRARNGVVVRVVEYTLAGVAGAEPLYRLLTTILDPDEAPAEEL